MRDIVEDTISRNKKFQEERRLRLKRFKELKAPDIIIETEEMISKMTLAEYNIYCQQLEEEEDKNIKSEYAKNNPIQKSIVDEIYNRESKLEYDYEKQNLNNSTSLVIFKRFDYFTNLLHESLIMIEEC